MPIMAMVRTGPLPRPVRVEPYDRRTHLQFVATAAVDLLWDQPSGLYRSRSHVAECVFGMKAPNLSAQLARAEGPTPAFLSALERHYLCSGNKLHNGAPWLNSFHEEVQEASIKSPTDAGEPVGNGESARHRSLGQVAAARREGVRIPIGWFHNLAEKPPRNSTESYVRGHALQSFLADAHRASEKAVVGVAQTKVLPDPKPGSPVVVDTILDRFGLTQKAESTVDYLLQVVAGPPHTGLRAVQIVASIGALAPALTLARVERFIHTHPAGFKAVRVLGRMLAIEQGRPADCRNPELLERIQSLLFRIYDTGAPDPYPARSLLVEALRFAPSDEGWKWVTEALARKARDEDRPTRERFYAAYVLFERNDFDALRQVMADFASSSDEALSYAADFLELCFKRDAGAGTTYEWPHDCIEWAIVHGATASAFVTVPHSVQGALRKMVRGALLTLDGTARRQILEAIQAAGLASDAVAGLRAVIEERKSPQWLLDHAAFSVGYLQTGFAEGAGAAVATLVPLTEDPAKSSDVRHAALWGIGDIVGSMGDIANLQPGWLAEPEAFLADLLDRCSQPANAARVRQGAAYAAAMLARRCRLGASRAPRKAISELLKRLGAKDEKDPLVRNLAVWGKRTLAARARNEGYLAAWDDPDS